MNVGIHNLGRIVVRRWIIVAVTGIAAACQICAFAECPPRYTVEVIQTQMCPSWPMPFEPAPGVATAIAEDGTIAGYYCQCGCKYDEAFICPPGTTIPIKMNRPSGIIGAEAHDVANGNVVCGTMIPSFQGMRGFLWFGFPVVNLGTMPSGNWSEALAINSHYQIVGFWGNNVTGPMPQAFVFQSGMMMDLNAALGRPTSSANDISENGMITGYMGTSYLTDAHAFIYDHGRIADLGTIPGGFTGQGLAINNHQDVVGIGRVSAAGHNFGLTHAVLWSNGKAIRLPELAGTTSSQAVAINDSRWIVGTCFGAAISLWHDGQVWDLNQLIEPGVVVRVAEPAGINNAGQIAIGCVVQIGNLLYNFPARLTPMPPQAGDVNCDRITNIDDLVGVITRWGPCPSGSSCDADLNGDQTINMDDLMIVILNWS